MDRRELLTGGLAAIFTRLPEAYDEGSFFEGLENLLPPELRKRADELKIPYVKALDRYLPDIDRWDKTENRKMDYYNPPDSIEVPVKLDFLKREAELQTYNYIGRIQGALVGANSEHKLRQMPCPGAIRMMGKDLQQIFYGALIAWCEEKGANALVISERYFDQIELYKVDGVLIAKLEFHIEAHLFKKTPLTPNP